MKHHHVEPERVDDLWLDITAQATQPHFAIDPGWPPLSDEQEKFNRRHREWLRVLEERQEAWMAEFRANPKLSFSEITRRSRVRLKAEKVRRKPRVFSPRLEFFEERDLPLLIESYTQPPPYFPDRAMEEKFMKMQLDKISKEMNALRWKGWGKTP
jgi:hypothetical protein